MWTGPLAEVLLWAFDLDGIDVESISAILIQAERERAARFRFDIHRERFIAARGALRAVLAHTMSTSPESIEFVYGDHGKPALKDGQLHFNLSHSDQWAIIGMTRAAPLGVDIERINPARANRDIAERFFAGQEIVDLAAQPDYAQAFFQCWARKESVLKAVGRGISGGLSSFAVPVDSMPEPVRLDEPNCWIGNLVTAFPYLESEGFASAVCLLEQKPVLRPVCDRVPSIPLRRKSK